MSAARAKKEFTALSATLDTLLENFRPTIQRYEFLDEREKKKNKASLQKDLATVNNTLNKMKELALQNPGTDISSRTRQYTYSVQTVEREVATLLNLTPNTKEPTHEELEAAQRSALLVGNKRLDKTGRVLDATYDLARDTEETGINALGELVRQREVLEGAQDDLDEMSEDVDGVRARVNAMGRKAITNKLILLIVIIILILTIAFIVYWKWIRPWCCMPPPAPQPWTPVSPPTAPPTAAPI